MAPDRVLREMRELGLQAVELGPAGYLGTTPEEVTRKLERHNLSLVAGFIPAVLYQPERLPQQLTNFARDLEILKAGGATVAVLGPDSHLDGYDELVTLGPEEWDLFYIALGQLQEIAAPTGLPVALHQHWGMAVHKQADLEQVLRHTSVRVCLDTGHLALVGADPVQLARRYGDRIDHVHLKDVDAELADRVRSGKLPFREAVTQGLFLPLGSGIVDAVGLITMLMGQGYQGWWVLEQDCALDSDPPPGEGPMLEVGKSLNFLRSQAEKLGW